MSQHVPMGRSLACVLGLLLALGSPSGAAAPATAASATAPPATAPPATAAPATAPPATAPPATAASATAPPATAPPATAPPATAPPATAPPATAPPATAPPATAPPAASPPPAKSRPRVEASPRPKAERTEEEELGDLEKDAGAEPAKAGKDSPGRRGAGERVLRFIQSMNPDISAIAILAAAYYYDHGLHGQGNIVPQGGHDPGKTGFHLQVFELALQAEIDPYFRMDAFLAISLEGIHFHEGYITSLGLPGGFQIKVGEINHQFGRHNTKHLHDWVFVDNIVPAARLLSGGHLTSLAFETSWMMPLPFYSVLSVALSMPNGSFLSSFVGDRSRKDGFNIKDPRHLLYVFHLAHFYELSTSWSLAPGLSYAIGPNNSGGYDLNMTHLFGADLFLKYRPLRRPYSEIQLSAEWYGRVMQIPEDQLFDWGLYAQASFRMGKRWFLALRYDMVQIGKPKQLLAFDFAQQSSDPEHPNPTGDQHRGSVSLSWQPTHFSQLRLQYNNNWTRRMTDEGEPGAFQQSHELILQLQGNIGTHGAHPY